MVILKQIISMCHIYKGMVPGDRGGQRVAEWYQIGYADDKDADEKVVGRKYMVSLTGLSRFATNYVNFNNRKDIKIDRNLIKDAILKLMISIDVPYDPAGGEILDINEYKNKDDITYREQNFKWKPSEKVTWVPTLKSSIRGYSLEIAAPHIAKIEALAMNNLIDLQGFLIHAFKFFI